MIDAIEIHNAPEEQGDLGEVAKGAGKWVVSQVKDAPSYQPSNEDQARGMQAMAGGALVGAVVAPGGRTGRIVFEAETLEQAAGFQKKLTPSQEAITWQGTELYPGIDRYKDITLKPGVYVVSASPGQGNYYTTISGLERTGLDVVKYYEGLQIAPNLTNAAYDVIRDGVIVYRVSESTPAAFSLTRANPQFGAGGLPQIYIPDYLSLQPVEFFPFVNKVPGVKP